MSLSMAPYCRHNRDRLLDLEQHTLQEWQVHLVWLIWLILINYVSLPWFWTQLGTQHTFGRFLINWNLLSQAPEGLIQYTSVCHAGLHAMVHFIKSVTAQVNLKIYMKQNVSRLTKHIWFWTRQIHILIFYICFPWTDLQVWISHWWNIIREICNMRHPLLRLDYNLHCSRVKTNHSNYTELPFIYLTSIFILIHIILIAVNNLGCGWQIKDLDPGYSEKRSIIVSGGQEIRQPKAPTLYILYKIISQLPKNSTVPNLSNIATA